MNRIKEVLEEKSFKEILLSKKLGKSCDMGYGYVQNRRQPSLEVLYKIAEILDVYIKELIILNKENN